MECTARIEGLSHRSSIASDKPRPDDSYLFLCPSAGTTLLRVSCVCLWPKAVVHGYILVVMCIKKDESMKAENDLEKNLGEHAARILGQGCDSTIKSHTLGLLKKCAASTSMRSERWPRLCKVFVDWIKLLKLLFRMILLLEDIVTA